MFSISWISDIFFNDDQDATPHYSELKSDKGLHVDGWKSDKRGHGDIKVAKKWATYWVAERRLDRAAGTQCPCCTVSFNFEV